MGVQAQVRIPITRLNGNDNTDKLQSKIPKLLIEKSSVTNIKMSIELPDGSKQGEPIEVNLLDIREATKLFI